MIIKHRQAKNSSPRRTGTETKHACTFFKTYSILVFFIKCLGELLCITKKQEGHMYVRSFESPLLSSVIGNIV